MEDHFRDVAADMYYPAALRYAAGHGLEKLLKYADIARASQYHKLATRVYNFFLSPTSS